ncbi:hypothetical protein ACELLULO517_12640 [Acidisoma cellulosilytica]|uniref:Uncharacterized protein n=1 Tax=Acidisoma cellulosilyticum TaxID=2802395 RepID=A0A964E444_9PROT|nr:hypothetical protein [Acidisoma cellulosilyticum]MCB8881086.1 hypothetical protein [Acidisoma cellulosilyticum]
MARTIKPLSSTILDRLTHVLVRYLGIRPSSPEALAAVVEPNQNFVRMLKASYWEPGQDLDTADRSAFFTLIALRFAGEAWPSQEQGKAYFTKTFLPRLHEGAEAAGWAVVEPGEQD